MTSPRLEKTSVGVQKSDFYPEKQSMRKKYSEHNADLSWNALSAGRLTLCWLATELHHLIVAITPQKEKDWSSRMYGRSSRVILPRADTVDIMTLPIEKLLHRVAALNSVT